MLGIDVGDKISVVVQPKNLLAGMKMFEKYQEASSKTEHTVETDDDIDPTILAGYLYDFMNVSSTDMSKAEFTYIIEVTFNQRTVI